MSTGESQAAVKNFLRAEFLREWESCFALLRRIPSTSVRKFLDYFSTLDVPGRDALSEGLAQRALCVFVPSASHPSKLGNIAYKQYVDALPLMWGWKYEGTRELRMILAVAKLEPDSRWARAMTSEIRERISAIKPVKSTEIRRTVKLALSQLLTPLAISHEEQYWTYEGRYRGRDASITIDYAARYHQLEYWVPLGDDKRPPWEGLNYERLMGLSFAHWDCLEQVNLDQSIALLRDLIIYCLEVLQRLPPFSQS